MSGGMKHMAFLVPDLQSHISALVRSGVDIAAVQRSPSEPMKMEADPAAITAPPAFAIFIRDPEGVLIKFLDQRSVAGSGMV
jgi:catechol 2,3-dioxygenase-like lactoylglutathione lyase family enzyme